MEGCQEQASYQCRLPCSCLSIPQRGICDGVSKAKGESVSECVTSGNAMHFFIHHIDSSLLLLCSSLQGDYFLMRDTFERFLSAAESSNIVRKHCDVMTPPSSRPSSSLDEINSGIKTAFVAACSPFVLGSGVYLPPPSFGRQVASTTAPSKMEDSPSMTAASATVAPSHMIKPLMAMAETDCRHENFEAARALARLSASGTLWRITLIGVG